MSRWNLVDSSFCDFYQISMMYAYWSAGKHEDEAVFDVYFRRCPFGGEFAVFAGLSEVVKLIREIKFDEDFISYIKTQLPPYAHPSFFDYLTSINGNSITLYAIEEGSLVFPREPLIRIEGPLAICQLLETSVINLTNYATLVATNASRFRLAAGWDKKLMEFGARRAQGPNGAMSASYYAYMGGFDSSSNTKAGYMFGIPISGTHAHSYVASFKDLSCLKSRHIDGFPDVDFVDLVLAKKTQYLQLKRPSAGSTMHEGELAAFINYAINFPNKVVCLVDTYDTMSSGVPNAICVSLALRQLGLASAAIRLDSGDLAYLSRAAREAFREVTEKLGVGLDCVQIVASNDVNESVLIALREQKHEIDCFGIGTQLVTCQAQPALGMVYKLSSLNGAPCIKISQEMDKTSVPFRKTVYRLYTDQPVIDLIDEVSSVAPEPNELISCQHLFDPTKRCRVKPARVVELLKMVYNCGETIIESPSLHEIREKCMQELKTFRQDHLRLLNPTPYKVSTSLPFHKRFHQIWQATVPVVTIE